MKRLILAIAAAAALAACETVPPPPPPPVEGPPPAAHFSADDFAWSTRPGAGSIEGLLSYRAGGTTYTCAGQPVILIPETPFSRRRMAQLYGSPDRAILPVTQVRSRQVGLPRDEYSAFVRNTQCDGQDHFVFRGMPDGGWFVVVVAKPASGSGETMAVMRHVATRGGTLRRVVFGE